MVVLGVMAFNPEDLVLCGVNMTEGGKPQLQIKLRTAAGLQTSSVSDTDYKVVVNSYKLLLQQMGVSEPYVDHAIQSALAALQPQEAPKGKPGEVVPIEE